ncbi:MAG: hypothetical protein KBD16_00665 [Candidatus Pacebacteria bacterium]|nr:hypothetical protein [Candidatus Paceibacterota bacterium]
MTEEFSAADWQKLAEEQRRFKLMRYDLKKRFGITIEQYDKVVRMQNGLCAICAKPPEKYLVVDAHKVSGIARGLLCNRCKVGIAYFNHDTSIMAAAIKYIDAFDERVARAAALRETPTEPTDTATE